MTPAPTRCNFSSFSSKLRIILNRNAFSSLDVPQTSQTQVQFMVTIPAGTSVEVVVDSADGEEGWSATVRCSVTSRMHLIYLYYIQTVVQPGKDSSCLPKNVTVSSSNQTASSTALASGTSTASATSTYVSLSLR